MNGTSGVADTTKVVSKHSMALRQDRRRKRNKSLKSRLAHIEVFHIYQ